MEERKEESRWCSSAKSETQRIIRKEIKSDTPIYCMIVLWSGKRTNSHNIQWRYWLESGWFQSFFLLKFSPPGKRLSWKYTIILPNVYDISTESIRSLNLETIRPFDWKKIVHARSYTFHDRTVPFNRSFQRKQSRLKVNDHQWDSHRERYTKIYDPQAEKVYDHQGSILKIFEVRFRI